MNLILFEKNEIDLPLPHTDTRARHLLNILKLQEGDCFFAGEVGGQWGTLQLLEISSKGLCFGNSVFHRLPSPLLPIHLLIGLPRPPTTRRLLRDLTTLGASRIVFSITELNEKSYLQSSLWKNDARLALLEGAMQAHTTLLPQLHVTGNLFQAFSLFEEQYSIKLHFDQDGVAFPQIQLESCPGIAALAVGPERGFTLKERQLFKEKNWASCQLSPRTLRTEIACSVAFALVQTRWFSITS